SAGKSYCLRNAPRLRGDPPRSQGTRAPARMSSSEGLQSCDLKDVECADAIRAGLRLGWAETILGRLQAYRRRRSWSARGFGCERRDEKVGVVCDPGRGRLSARCGALFRISAEGTGARAAGSNGT